MPHHIQSSTITSLFYRLYLKLGICYGISMIPQPLPSTNQSPQEKPINQTPKSATSSNLPSAYPLRDYEIIRNTPSNFRRTSATLFAGVTAIGLGAMLALLRLKPTLYLSLKARFNEPVVVKVTKMLPACEYNLSCSLTFKSYSLPYSTQTITLLQANQKNSSFNPAVILALYYALSEELYPKQPNLENLSQIINTITSNQTDFIPRVFHSPTFGYFELNQFSSQDYAVFLTLINLATNKAILLDALTPPIPTDNQIKGFTEIYYQITSALTPQSTQ